MKGLSYRASANYAFAEHGAYVIGPIQGIGLGEGGYGNFVGNPELNPVDGSAPRSDSSTIRR